MFQIVQHDYFSQVGLPLPDKSCRIGFGDGPYNQGVEYADDPSGDELELDSYRLLNRVAIEQMSRLLVPGGTGWWMCPERHADWIGPMMTQLVGPRIARIVWQETFSQYQGERGLTQDYRFIFLHQKPGGPLVFNPNSIRVPSDRQIKYKDKRADPRGRVPGWIWKVRRLQGTSNDRVDWHNTQLPPELLERIVLGWSNPGETVVDMFAGSGTMGVACERLGRNSILIDRSPTYCQKMQERLAPKKAA